MSRSNHPLVPLLATAAAAGLALYLYKTLSAPKKPKKKVVFVLGPPGAGKGTQCSLLVERYPSLPFFSAGDLLRAERSSGSDLAAVINGKISAGEFVPASITVGLLKRAMEEVGAPLYVVDGFPRTPDNVSAWDAILGDACETQFCLFLDCPESILVDRILSRGVGRSDDTLPVLRRRFENYKAETLPIVEAFEAEGKLRRVRADRDKAVVFEDVLGAFRGAGLL